MDGPTPGDAPPVFERDDVTRLHLSNWVKALPFAALLPQLMRLISVNDVGPDVYGIVSFGMLVLLLAIVILGLNRLNDRRVEAGRIRVDGAGLHWNGSLLVPRAKMTVGVVMPGIQTSRTQIAARVRISRRRGRAIEFGVTDIDHGRAVLRALGLDTTQATASFRAQSRAMHTHATGWLGILAVLTGLSAAAAASSVVPWAMGLLPFVVMAMVVPLVVPTTVVVGTDGVLLKWFGTRRFVPYADLVSVHADGVGVRFVLRNGKSVPIRFGSNRNKTRVRQAEIERDAFIARVEQARNSATTRETTVDPSTVARGNHDTPAWVAALKSLTHREGGMRTAPVLRDQLFDLVSNTTLDPSARAGAAAALGLDAAEPERERLRVAAAMIASPKLRVVVEAAANGDEEKLLAALDDLPDERARSQRAG